MFPFEKALISEAVVLLKILIVIPATNAVSERSFSALRRLKTNMRSTMSQDRLNHLLFLHAHKHYTNSLDLIAVANDFVSFSEQRIQIFGKFSEDDIISGARGYCQKCKLTLECSKCCQ